MMNLIQVETTEAGRKALCEIYFKDTTSNEIAERFWIVGELPFFGDDTDMKLEFALMGTIRFSNIDDAKTFYAEFKCQQKKLSEKGQK